MYDYFLVLQEEMYNNIVPYVNIIFTVIQQRVLHQIDQNSLTQGFTYETTETSLANQIGAVIANTITNNLPDLESLFNLTLKKEKDIEKFENLWILLFNYFRKGINAHRNGFYSTLTKEEIDSVMKYFPLIPSCILRDDPIMFNLVVHKILAKGINSLIRNKESIAFINIANNIDQQGINQAKLIALEKILQETRAIDHVHIGSVIVNFLIDMGIFKLYTAEKDHEDSDKECPSNEKFTTTNMLRLDHDLSHDLIANGSGFKPY